MNGGLAIVLVAALAGCSDVSPAAHVWLDVVDTPRLSVYLEAAREWEAIGFSVDFESSGLPECRGGARDPDCEVHVTLVRVPRVVLEGQGCPSDGCSRIATGDIAVESTIEVGTLLRIIVSHEVGHVLLNTGRHASRTAIMAGTWTEVTDRDRQLACETIGVCTPLEGF